MRDKGAHFRRCDFQIHTPRDNQWKGDRPALGDRFAYAQAFVTACRDAGIGAVAITDHHDFAYVPHIRRAAAEETGKDGQPLDPEDRLVVFPGLELTSIVRPAVLMVGGAGWWVTVGGGVWFWSGWAVWGREGSKGVWCGWLSCGGGGCVAGVGRGRSGQRGS